MRRWRASISTTASCRPMRLATGRWRSTSATWRRWARSRVPRCCRWCCPDALDVAVVDGMLDGLLALAARHGVTLIGGNISRSPGPLVVDVTAVGSVRPRRVLRRAGARPGDGVYVTGSIGDALVGLHSLQDERAGSAGTRTARVRAADGGAALSVSRAAGPHRHAARTKSRGHRMHGPERRARRRRPAGCRRVATWASRSTLTRCPSPTRCGAGTRITTPTRSRRRSRAATTTSCCSRRGPHMRGRLRERHRHMRAACRSRESAR